MVEIIQSSEYNARAIKSSNFKTKTKGYNISYPVQNSIEICGLLIDGGSITIKKSSKIKIESTWSFDTDTNILIIHTEKYQKENGITEDGTTEKYHISDAEELHNAIDAYFKEHGKELIAKVAGISRKKSISKQGNKNACKPSPVNMAIGAKIEDKSTPYDVPSAEEMKRIRNRNEYGLDFNDFDVDEFLSAPPEQKQPEVVIKMPSKNDKEWLD